MTNATALRKETTVNEDMQFHDYADYFPLMEGDEFDDLVADIKQHGLLEPIVLYEGKILDGRNRWRACQGADVKPRFREYENGSPLHYVKSKNINRRHLTPTQQATILVDMKEELQDEIRREEEARGIRRDPETGGFKKGTAARPDDAPESGDSGGKGRWYERAAEGSGTSGTTVRRVDRVKREAPELMPKLRSGEMSAKAAEREIRKRRARESAARDRARETKKKRQEPREVKLFLDAIRNFREAAKEAVEVAAYGKFSPEAQRFVTRWFKDIRGLLAKIEEEFDA